MKSAFNYLFLIVLLLISSAGYAGGWTQAKDQGFLKLSQSVLRADKFYEADGNVIDIFTTSVYLTSFYGEYGFSDRLTGVAYLPFFSRVTVNEIHFTSGKIQPGDQYNNVGDADIGLKWGIRQNKPLVLSAGIFLGLPLGGTQGGESQALQTGDGEFNQMVKLEAGYGFQKAPIYISGGVGFNNRTEGFSEEFRYEFELGYGLAKKKLWVILKSAGIESFMNGNPTGTANGLFSNNLEFLAIGPEVAYTIKDKYGFSFNYTSAFFGRQILAAPSYAVGVFLKLK